MDRSRYYAHSGTSEDREHWHRLSWHLEGTGARAASFLDAVGGADIGRVAGLLHDLGKYTQEFQDRLSGGRKRVNHSTAGAKVAVERYPGHLGKMLAFCIAGHHSGLANGVNGGQTTALEARLKEQVSAPDPIWEQEIALPANLPSPLLIPRDPETAGFCAAFFIRMLFSALVDADYLDTEDYFAGLEGGTKPRGQHPALDELRERLNAYLDQLAAGAEASPVNDLRQEVLAHVRGKAAESPGLFALTVPTGGGKTLASLAFALDHARRRGLARVIYVIPLGMRRNTGLEGELQGLTCIVAQPGQPGTRYQLHPQMPRGSAAQQEPPVFGWRFGRAFKKQLDACDEGCLHFIEAGGERCDVEVNANRLPCVAIPIGVTPKGEDHCGVRTRGLLDAAVKCDQGLRPSFHLPGTPIDD